MKNKLIQKMRKLLELQKWVTVPDAAYKLTIFLGVEVSQAEVLRFALEGSLKLSVNFVNTVEAKRGEIVAKDEVTSKVALPTEGCPPILFRNWVDIGGGQCIKLDDKVVSLEGVWDLPMIRSERLAVERMHQGLIGGPEVSIEGDLEGAFVGEIDGLIFQLQVKNDFDYQKYLSADLEKINELKRYNKIDAETANELLNQNEENREMYLKKKIEENPSDGYYPVDLPHDIDFVVRSQALIDLCIRLLQDPEELPINRRAETTYLNIIGALLEIIKGESPGTQKKPVFKSEAELIRHLSDFGCSGLSKSTLEDKFKEAKRSFHSI